jgi:putative FmdB family regulatory protein
MPIYEYRCNDCGNVSEFLARTHAEKPAHCRICGRGALKRIISAAHMGAATSGRPPGATCCGRQERCERPPCSEGGGCVR